MISEVFNMDCMVGMKNYPDKYFDLAVVDPPYGIDIAKNGTLNTSSKTVDLYKPSQWDKERPSDEYFIELFRVSRHQIIWGGNYFPFIWQNPCRGFIHWDKMNHTDNRADGELAWTSFDMCSLNFRYMWDGNRYGFAGKINGVGKPSIRIHVTQKPIELYEWIYLNCLPEGGKVIDTHLGSGSNRIAADKAGNIDFTGYELDKDYFEAQEKRFRDYKSQLVLDLK